MATEKSEISPRPKRGKGNAPKNMPEVTTKGKPWTFPKNTLEEAIRIPKAIEEKNAGNPMRAPELAAAVSWLMTAVVGRQSGDLIEFLIQDMRNIMSGGATISP